MKGMKKSLLSVVCLIAFTYIGLSQETFEEKNIKFVASTQTTTEPVQTLQVNITGQRNSPPVNILDEMNTNYQTFYSQYSSGEMLSKTGWTLLGSGSAFFALGVYLINIDDTFLNIWLGATSTCIGTACLITSVPYFITGSIKKNRAVKEFNRQYYYLSQPSPHFQLNAYSNRVGIAYVF